MTGRAPRAVPMGDAPGAPEYGYVVQWCESKSEALALALLADDEDRRYEYGEVGASPSPVDLAAAGHADDLVVDEPRYFRWNPCSPSSCWDGGGHRGHLEEVAGPGRGRWRGVQVRRAGRCRGVASGA